MQHKSNEKRKPAGCASGLLRNNRAGIDMSSRALGLRRGLAAATTALAMLGADGATPALAQVLAEGQPDAVHVEVNDAPLRNVLDMLQEKFSLHYRTNDALDTPVTGTFNGPLRRVTVRILDGYDFAMQVTPAGIDVLVLRQSDGKAAVPAAPARAPVRSPARVMTAQEANQHERANAR